MAGFGTVFTLLGITIASPATSLLAAGAEVRAYDPIAMDLAHSLLPGVEMSPDPYQLAQGSDGLLVVTEWNEFKNLDLERIQKLMKTAILLDGRNIYNPEEMKRMGFTYLGIGRGGEGHD